MDLTQVEFANEAFYLAFESRDVEAMAHLWSSSEDILCCHPGWPVLVGRDAVLDSWRNILTNPQQGHVSFYDAQVMAWSDAIAAVQCYEHTGDVVMLAVNVFRQEAGGLRLISHQAGYCANPPADPTL